MIQVTCFYKMARVSVRFCMLVFLQICAFTWSAKVQDAFVVKDESGNFKIMESQEVNWVARAEFANSVNETGWATLAVTTNPQYADEDQAYAAGLVEGYLTKSLIKMHWDNTINGQFCDEPMTPECVALRNFLQDNISWMKKQAQSNTDPYWHMVKLFMVQVDGLTDGYFHNPKQPSVDIDPFGLLVLSLSGDMEDIPNALRPSGLKPKPVGSGSCSALIKLLPGNKDLYVAHDTWDSYQSMLRVLKKYDFGFHMNDNSSDLVPGKVITMSSYPGVLLSGDDFYLISSGLASQETTIGNNNPSLYKYVTFDTVLEGVRTMVANRMAKSGDMWAQIFQKYNSGTYNNQWMVVDFERFSPGFEPLAGTLTVLEQIPGTVLYADKTDVLKSQSYWPSYNIAYFPEIFNKSGCWNNVRKYGDWFTYDKAPRAQIFKRDQGKVVDLVSMQKLMRYNDFQHDPLARCQCTPPYSGENGISARSDLNPASGTYPFGALGHRSHGGTDMKHDPLARCNCTPPYSGENGISARCDLNPTNGTYPFEVLGHRSHGGTDMKLTNTDMMKNLEFIAISGPTFDQLPPFQWSKADFASACPHYGHPDVFKFDPIKFNGNFQRTADGNIVHEYFHTK